MDEARRETAAAREQHRRELDGLIEQLREVKSHLEPILEERKATRAARREALWGWISKGGWLLLVGVAVAVWHYLREHLR